MKSFLATLVVVLVFVGLFTEQAEARSKFQTSRFCMQTARELGQIGQADSPLMHYVGCDSDPNNTYGTKWGNLPGSCNSRARQAHKRDLVLFTSDYHRFVGTEGHCVLNGDDLTWESE